jgi:uncharacterized membrane protein YphA (DoxX/SURF4 family)
VAKEHGTLILRIAGVTELLGGILLILNLKFLRFVNTLLVEYLKMVTLLFHSPFLAESASD